MLKEISNKNKPNKLAKLKIRPRQMEEQLVQCKARIVILEDTNRDYKNTINMLRSQLEVRCNLTEGNQNSSMKENDSHTIPPQPEVNSDSLER
jgi:hypothetical protein